METKHEGEFSELEPKIPQFQQEALLDIIEEIKLRVIDASTIHLHLQALVLAGHEGNHFLYAFEVQGEMNLYLAVGSVMVFVALEECNQLWQ